MKKTIIILMACAACVFGACGDDDNDGPSATDTELAARILGTWQMQTVTYCEKCDTNNYTTFYADSTVVDHSRCEELGCDCEDCHTLSGDFAYDEDQKSRWYIEGGQIYILYGETDDWMTDFVDMLTSGAEILTLTATDLRLRMDVLGKTYEASYRKINDN